MDQQENSSLGERVVEKIRTSTTIRLFIIGVLILILLIPGNMIQDLIRERQSNHDTAINEISDKWGRDQHITGPVLVIPYLETQIRENEKNYTVTKRYSYYMPDDLEVKGNIKSQKRNRGIYEAVLYEGSLQIKGSFGPDFMKALPALPENAILSEAKLFVGISDVRSIRDKITLEWDTSSVRAEPGGNLEIPGSSISFPLGGVNFSSGGSFKFNIVLAGSQSMYFTPVAKNNSVHIESDWATPSFDGAFLPINRTVSDTGFVADWKVLELNRSFMQHWNGNFGEIHESDFGVKMWIAADEYQKTHRSVRYCILFIALTFIFYFIIELRSKVNVHPVQYLLIGLAISMFYLLLLSLSEWLGFNKAYFISAAAITGLISLFSVSVLRSTRYSIVAGVVQVMLYVFLFTTLQLEDLSLLIGTIGLFITLAILMFFSRKLNTAQPE